DRAKLLPLLQEKVKPAFKNQDGIPAEPLLADIIPRRESVREKLKADAEPVLKAAGESEDTAAPPEDQKVSDEVRKARADLTSKYGGFFMPADTVQGKL